MSVFFSLVLASSAGATPIEFEENWLYPEGFPESGSGYLVGTLDVGVNRIYGSLLTQWNFYPDSDRIRVELPAGLLITSIELSVSSFSNEGDGSSGIGLVSPNSGGESFDGVGTVDVDPFTISSSPIVFWLEAGVDFEPVPPIYFDNADYTLSVTVDIPEPATITTLALGLIGMAAIRRRRTAA
jgi:hypothetical protein